MIAQKNIRILSFMVGSFLLLASYQNCGKNVNFSDDGNLSSENPQAKIDFIFAMSGSGAPNENMTFSVTSAWLENEDGSTDPVVIKSSDVTWSVLDANGNVTDSVVANPGSMSFPAGDHAMSVTVRAAGSSKVKFFSAVIRDPSLPCLPLAQSFSIVGSLNLTQADQGRPIEYRLVDNNEAGGGTAGTPGRCYNLDMRSLAWEIRTVDGSKPALPTITDQGNPAKVVFQLSGDYTLTASFRVFDNQGVLVNSSASRTPIQARFDSQGEVCAYDEVTDKDLVCNLQSSSYRWTCGCADGSVGMGTVCRDTNDNVVDNSFCGGGTPPTLTCLARACPTEVIRGATEPKDGKDLGATSDPGNPYINQTVNCSLKMSTMTEQYSTSNWGVDIHRGDVIEEVSIPNQNPNGSIDYYLRYVGTYTFKTTVRKVGCVNTREIKLTPPINTGATECDLNPRSCVGYQWSSSACTGQCITNPWWTVAPGGWICLNNANPHSAPDNPYDASKCGGVPRYDSFDHTQPVVCTTICSPWGGDATM